MTAATALSTTLSHVWNRVDSRFDRIAIGISGLCVVHCIATSVLLVVMASAGALLDPHIHEVGLVFAILFGVLALGKGIVTHGYMMPAAVGGFGLGMMAGALHVPHGSSEILFTLLGVFFLVLGHDLNRRATH
ncbi:MerC domain-containing protein [Stakelama pacifica]|uniref:MerC mercury resistance protein n=1 Tax=Stakelama pacifica TaxID=517720 RepID=A0A4R6FEK8_9SPHN|nr:MerC domain-containing protein [Stakelama pacifica]MAW98697.1 hypothetical protein [Sphingomonas sp.]TDN78765.1 MerC mercury resistance protein [Stakelama pacifica]GGO99168.1 hypothetical protein GCM10011329_32040 [Stakelama pacifica]